MLKDAGRSIETVNPGAELDRMVAEHVMKNVEEKDGVKCYRKGKKLLELPESYSTDLDLAAKVFAKIEEDYDIGEVIRRHGARGFKMTVQTPAGFLEATGQTEAHAVCLVACKIAGLKTLLS